MVDGSRGRITKPNTSLTGIVETNYSMENSIAVGLPSLAYGEDSKLTASLCITLHHRHASSPCIGNLVMGLALRRNVGRALRTAARDVPQGIDPLGLFLGWRSGFGHASVRRDHGVDTSLPSPSTLCQEYPARYWHR